MSPDDILKIVGGILAEGGGFSASNAINEIKLAMGNMQIEVRNYLDQLIIE